VGEKIGPILFNFLIRIFVSCNDYNNLGIIKRVKGWEEIGLKGLQIQCGALSGVPGGFDSHALPPKY
jgi:hypothetical protein